MTASAYRSVKERLNQGQGKGNLYRIIDANYNRAKEGLRVCEDIFRFLHDKAEIAGEYKRIRHRVSEAASLLPIDEVIKARDAASDVGRGPCRLESCRESVNDIFFANSQRVKESIRVLEEFSKLFDKSAAEEFKRLRYDIYELEQRGGLLLLSR